MPEYICRMHIVSESTVEVVYETESRTAAYDKAKAFPNSEVVEYLDGGENVVSRVVVLSVVEDNEDEGHN